MGGNTNLIGQFDGNENENNY